MRWIRMCLRAMFNPDKWIVSQVHDQKKGGYHVFLRVAHTKSGFVFRDSVALDDNVLEFLPRLRTLVLRAIEHIEGKSPELTRQIEESVTKPMEDD